MPAPIIEGTWLTGADEPATLETAVNESARQYVHDGTVHSPGQEIRNRCRHG